MKSARLRSEQAEAEETSVMMVAAMAAVGVTVSETAEAEEATTAGAICVAGAIEMPRRMMERTIGVTRDAMTPHVRKGVSRRGDLAAPVVRNPLVVNAASLLHEVIRMIGAPAVPNVKSHLHARSLVRRGLQLGDVPEMRILRLAARPRQGGRSLSLPLMKMMASRL